MKNLTKKEIRIIKYSGYAGVFGAMLAGLGEFLLHYSPNVLNNGELYGFLSYVSMNNLFVGHFLAVAGIPFYFIGYFHLYKMLNRERIILAKIFFIFGILSFIAGGIWLSSRGFLGTIVHYKDVMNPEIYEPIIYSYTFLLESMVQALRFFISIVSVLWIYIILKNKTYYPKWMSIFNPLSLLVLTFLTLFIPTIGKYLVPIAMNFVHLIIFTLSLICLSNFIKKGE